LQKKGTLKKGWFKKLILQKGGVDIFETLLKHTVLTQCKQLTDSTKRLTRQVWAKFIETSPYYLHFLLVLSQKLSLLTTGNESRLTTLTSNKITILCQSAFLYSIVPDPTEA
jgi:hypothetical protein